MAKEKKEVIKKEIHVDEADAEKLLSALLQIAQEKSIDDKVDYNENYINDLKVLHKKFLKKDNFEVGQIVKWKKGLKNRRLPLENQPVIILELLDEPVFDSEARSGSPYFLEPLDVVLGILDSDGDFIRFYYDRRRFEPYKK
ncbi:hypothetical protein [Desulfonema magnum]|uniref:Uncharacterized protein n=1 Tax=Desulfonema magnum TaxID=45655 RepID=A0A975BJD2_9BACT|nr:hypothetical protein [Desulfonema magnum]QTA86450.1 Uncharacterized protein dnm_024730 [Desulfonema magnum]